MTCCLKKCRLRDVLAFGFSFHRAHSCVYHGRKSRYRCQKVLPGNCVAGGENRAQLASKPAKRVDGPTLPWLWLWFRQT